MAQYFMYTVGDDSQPTPPPSAEEMAAIGAYMQESIAAGIIVATGGFAPSATETRVLLENGTSVVHDGPFTEAKELIGGWALLELRDLDEAVLHAKRFQAITGVGETRIRQTFGPGSFDELPQA
jgi:hypothetical protein